MSLSRTSRETELILPRVFSIIVTGSMLKKRIRAIPCIYATVCSWPNDQTVHKLEIMFLIIECKTIFNYFMEVDLTHTLKTDRDTTWNATQLVFYKHYWYVFTLYLSNIPDRFSASWRSKSWKSLSLIMAIFLSSTKIKWRHSNTGSSKYCLRIFPEN